LSGDSEKKLKRMADLLRSGARMLPQFCPVCGSPLFEMPSGEVWCANCEKKVVIVKEGEAETAAMKALLWPSLEESILGKLKEIDVRIRDEEDPEELFRLGRILNTLLEALERLRRVRS